MARMFRDDYIVRTIQQAAAALARILGLNDAERHAEALQQVDSALQQFVGLNLGLVSGLSAPDLIEFARVGEALDVGKLVVLGELLYAQGEIHRALDQTTDAWGCYVRALEVLLEVAETGDHNLAAVAPRLAALKTRLDPAQLDPALREWWAHVDARLAAPPAH
jgi:hypothetical protein